MLAYLTLDLSNPLMPGALYFVDGRLEVVDAGRPSAVQAPTSTVMEEAAPAWTAPVQTRVAPRPVPDGEPRRPWAPMRRLLGSVSAPTASPSDH
jgi:hypothetical protein